MLVPQLFCDGKMGSRNVQEAAQLLSFHWSLVSHSPRAFGALHLGKEALGLRPSFCARNPILTWAEWQGHGETCYL